MSKKQGPNIRETAFTADDFADAGKKRLDIREIRVRYERLLTLPDGAPMPDFSDLTVTDRFRVALRFVPTDQWEQLLGKSMSRIRGYEQGKLIPLPSMAALAAETEFPLDWLVTGRAQERRPPLVPGQLEELEDVPLQKLAFRPAAGHGTLVLDEQADYVRFPRAILRRHDIKEQNARLMESSGESMYPTIADRDLLLVDISSTEIIEGKVYVFSIGGEAYVKRLRRMNGKVFMFSDNRELFPEPEAVPENQPFKIHAQVKWTGRSL